MGMINKDPNKPSVLYWDTSTSKLAERNPHQRMEAVQHSAGGQGPEPHQDRLLVHVGPDRRPVDDVLPQRYRLLGRRAKGRRKEVT